MPKLLSAGPQAVIEYLGRYTHKVAISNHRIQSINEENDTVIFTYKDYSDDGTQKQMTLTSDEFIRRLPLHKEQVKIPIEVRMLEQYGIDMKECPVCKNRTLQLVKIFYPWKQADDG